MAKATVVRNVEGEGLALSFGELSPEARALLERSLDLMAEGESSFSKDDQPTQVIVSEILDPSSD